MDDRLCDARLRVAAFEWLTAQVDAHGDVLPRSLLSDGFDFEGMRVPLVAPQGIFKPQASPELPLSITTAPSGPYDDSFGPGGLIRYRYRGVDPAHPDNRRLREAMRQRVPLVYFHGIVPGKYLAVWPVYIVHDDPASLTFTVAADDAMFARDVDQLASVSPLAREEGFEARREYVTGTVRKRLHQRAFRERVLHAYREQCALCHLRHEELLDAAHIVPDSEPEGEPVVSNGLALCKLHHAAFDRHFLGIRPDFVVEIRADLLIEKDGPTLLHAIQALHGKTILLPREVSHRPSVVLLESRYERFRNAS